MVKELLLPGFSLARVYDEVTSTMDVARESIAELCGGHGVICARCQTAGRGRQGRAWVSPSDGLMVTFLFSTNAPVHACAGYSLAVGVGVARAFEGIGANLALKWPNDLVIVERDAVLKVGGILTEVQDIGAARILLVGIGVNLRSAPDLREGVSSLEAIGGASVAQEEALGLLAPALLEVHRVFTSSDGFRPFREEWEARSCYEKGRTLVVLDRGDQSLSGTFMGVEESGALILEVGGERTLCHSGHTLELRHLRGG